MQQGKRRRALALAFPHTVPILAGFLFLGMAYGIYMNVSGFPFWYSMLMGLTIFGGSLELVAVSMLLAPFAPVQTFLMALMLQARHLFYGIAMLEKYRDGGQKRWYLIFGMLVIYCLKGVQWTAGSHGLPEIIAILVTIGLNRWKRQMLLSIAGGTVCCMLLVQWVF